MTTFKQSAKLENTLHIGSGISGDGQAVTVMFDDLQVELANTKQSSLVSTLVASIVIPVEKNGAEVTVKQDIRGYVSIDKGARAALVAHFAGQTILVDLPQGPCVDEAFIRTYTATLLAGGDYWATFFLLVERDLDDSVAGGNLGIDSLDVVLGQNKRGVN